MPDFSFLLYPVITMAPSHTHPGSRAIALGPAASPAIEELLSAEKQVTERVPPTVLVHSMNDTTVPVENSLRYLAALRSHGVRAAAHIYDHGGHGFGCGYSDYKTKTVDAMLQTWPEFTLQFLCSVGFVVKL